MIIVSGCWDVEAAVGCDQGQTRPLGAQWSHLPLYRYCEGSLDTAESQGSACAGMALLCPADAVLEPGVPGRWRAMPARTGHESSDRTSQKNDRAVRPWELSRTPGMNKKLKTGTNVWSTMCHNNHHLILLLKSVACLKCQILYFYYNFTN